MIKIGSLSLKSNGGIYVGSTKIASAYVGSTLVYQVSVAPAPSLPASLDISGDDYYAGTYTLDSSQGKHWESSTPGKYVGYDGFNDGKWWLVSAGGGAEYYISGTGDISEILGTKEWTPSDEWMPSLTITIVITGASVTPTITLSQNSATVSGTTGTTITSLDLSQYVTTTPNDLTVTYSASGLPSGLSLSSAGVLSGTPSATSSSSVTVTLSATGAQSVSFTLTFNITAAQPEHQYVYTVSNAGDSLANGNYWQNPEWTDEYINENGYVLRFQMAYPCWEILNDEYIDRYLGPNDDTSPVGEWYTNGGSSPAPTVSLYGGSVTPVITVNTATTNVTGTVGTAITSVDLSSNVSVTPSGTALTFSANSLPSGLSLSSAGVLSGTPSVTSSDTVTVTVSATGATSQTISLVFAITAAASGGYVVSGAGDAAFDGTYTRGEDQYQAGIGTVEVYWNESGLIALWGNTDYGWSLEETYGNPNVNNNPPQYASDTNTITGPWTTVTGIDPAPTVSGSGGGSVTPVITIVQNTVNVSGTEGTAITSIDLSDSSYVTVTQGATLTFSASNLPAGLSLSSAGVLSGTPSATSSASVTVTVSATGATSQTLTLVFAIEAAASGSSNYTVSGHATSSVNGVYEPYDTNGYDNSQTYSNGTWYLSRCYDDDGNLGWVISDDVMAYNPGPMEQDTVAYVINSSETVPTGQWNNCTVTAGGSSSGGGGGSSGDSNYPSSTKAGTLANPYYWDDLVTDGTRQHTSTITTSETNATVEGRYIACVYVYLEAGTTYRMGDNPYVDGYFYLFDKNGNIILDDDDRTHSGMEGNVVGDYYCSDALEYTPSTSDWYIIGAGAYGAAQSESFTLHMNPAPGTSGSSPSVTPVITVVTASTTVSGTVGNAITSVNLANNVSVSPSGTELTFSASNLPTGLSLSSAGVLSGTPSATSSATVTVTVAATGATSQTLTLVFDIETAQSSGGDYVVNGAGSTYFDGTYIRGADDEIAGIGTVEIYWLDGVSGSLALWGNSTYGWFLEDTYGTPYVNNAPPHYQSETTSITGSWTAVMGDLDAPTVTAAGGSVTPVITIVQNSVAVNGTENTAISSIDLSNSAYVTVTQNATLTFSASNLPTGISLSSAGVLSGTPSSSYSGNVTVTVAAQGATSQTLTLAFNIAAAQQQISPTIIAHDTTVSGTVGTALSVDLSNYVTVNNADTVIYAINDTLPSGLSLSTAGVLSGTPTAASLDTIHVGIEAENSYDVAYSSMVVDFNIASVPLSFSVSSPVVVNKSTGQNINIDLHNYITTNAARLEFSTANMDPLPSGLSFNTSTGVLSGSVSEATSGSYWIVVTAWDADDEDFISDDIYINLTVTANAGLDAETQTHVANVYGTYPTVSYDTSTEEIATLNALIYEDEI